MFQQIADPSKDGRCLGVLDSELAKWLTQEAPQIDADALMGQLSRILQCGQKCPPLSV